MSQCVPSWGMDESPPAARLPFHPNSNIHDAKILDVGDPTLDYEVAELTWENGQIALHGLGPPRAILKPTSSKETWEKPRASGTLESIVNQAALLAPCEDSSTLPDEFVPWFNHTMDALVPSSKHTDQGVGTCVTTGKSTHVESSGGSAPLERGKEVDGRMVKKRARVAIPLEVSSRNHSVSVSETFGRETRQVGVDSCGFTSTSIGSYTNLNTFEDLDSVSHSRPQKQPRTEDEKSCQNEKSTISTKRSRAAAIHNQSERKRRDKINQRMKTLQKLVPNSSKTDKASMLDEVIDYLKTLQAQVQMMNRMGMPHMMMPMAMQQQLQMAMMAQMGMGMGMGMGVMDMNSIGRPNIAGMPTAFMPMASWDGTTDRLPSSGPVLPDPMTSFLACHTQQPMTMDAYSRMASMYQQLHQQQVPNSKP